MKPDEVGRRLTRGRWDRAYDRLFRYDGRRRFEDGAILGHVLRNVLDRRRETCSRSGQARAGMFVSSIRRQCRRLCEHDGMGIFNPVVAQGAGQFLAEDECCSASSPSRSAVPRRREGAVVETL